MLRVVQCDSSTSAGCERLSLLPARRKWTRDASAVPTKEAERTKSNETGRAETQTPLLRLVFGSAVAHDGLAEHGRQTKDGLVIGLALIAGAIVVSALLTRR